MRAQAHPNVGPVLFKQGMRALVGGVAVVTAYDAAGASLGLTATSVSSLSADPPALVVCVNAASAMAQALAAGAAFGVNLLAHDQAEVAQAFGGQRPVRGMGRFAYGAWHRGALDTPLLTGARVAFECVVAETLGYATHRIVVGRVAEIHFGDPAARPLVYHDGRYATTEEA